MSESTEDGGINIVTFSDGKTVTVKNGSKGSQGEKGADGKTGTDGITPTIGDNGNWYLGETDTGKPSRGEDGAGMEIAGASVGQTVKISAVDSNGVPTAWEPVDMVSGGGIGQFRHIRKVTIPEDITTDTSGVNFLARDNGGYYFGFDTDENGDAFELTELLIFSEAGGVGAFQTFNINIETAIPGYYQVSFQTQLEVGKSGKKVFSMSHSFLSADGVSYAYGATFGGGSSNNVTALSKANIGRATSIKKISAGALNNRDNGFISGSYFDFWGR